MDVKQKIDDHDVLGAEAGVERLFAIGGILLILSGMIFGDLYAIFVLHPNIDAINGALAQATAAVAQQDVDQVWAQFTALGGFLENAGTKKDTHVHILHAGYLALFLAFIQYRVALEPKTKLILARLFLISSIVLPVSIFLIHYVGLVYSPLKSIGWASIFADLSGLLLAIITILQLWGLVKSGKTTSTLPTKASLMKNPQSRMLLKVGSVLVLLGFLVGAWQAGFNLANNEQAELTILTEIVEQAQAKDMDAAQQSLMAYGMLQADRGLTIAAHAHVVEFGLLAIMLALIQPYVFLAAALKKRLVTMLLIGSVVLPVAVYAELWFGLLAGGIADVAGLFVILAMFGMLGGVMRYTGVADKSCGGEL